MSTSQQTSAQIAAALNPAAKSFSPVTATAGSGTNIPTTTSATSVGSRTGTNTTNNSGNSSAATAPLPAGEGTSSSSSQNIGGGGISRGNFGSGGGSGAYVPPARQQGSSNVGPPLHHQNQNPTLYHGGGGPSGGNVNGHGNSSFYPSHSGGSGGGQAGPGRFGYNNNNNNNNGQFGNNNNNGPAGVGNNVNGYPHHHHHHNSNIPHHHQHHGSNSGNNNNNFVAPGPHHSHSHGHHHNHHPSVAGGPNTGNLAFAPHQLHHHHQHHNHHVHHHQYHHNSHIHHQSHQHNNVVPPNLTGGNNLNNNNFVAPGNNINSNFVAPHHQHNPHHHNQHHHQMTHNAHHQNNNFPHNHNNHHHPSSGGGIGVPINNNNNSNFNNALPLQHQPQMIPHPRGGGGRQRGMMGPNNNNNMNNMNNNNSHMNMNMNNNNNLHPGGNNNNNQTRAREPRKAVVVLGAPKSGKTTLAKRIVKELSNFHYIEAPLDREKFETLSEELKKVSNDSGHHDKMLVLDGFGADHDADLFYLGSVLKRYNFSVYGLIYLNLGKPAETISSRQERVPPSTAQMFGHAVAFETCAMYDNSRNLILIDADLHPDAVFAKFAEMWQDAQLVPLEIAAPKVLRAIDRSLSWKMETYGEFKIVTQALEKALPANATSSGSSPMPLRSPYGPLAYQHFARMFARLPKYNVSLMTNGQRVVLFAFNGCLYFLPEHGYYVFRYEPSNSPPHASRVNQWFDDLALRCDKPESTCPLVLDAEYVIFQNEEYILLRDILVFGSEPCYNLPLRERIERMTSCMRDRAGDESNGMIQILPHRYANVESVKDIFSVWERAEETGEDPSQTVTKVGVGVRLEPPGEYPVGQHDPSLLYWFDPERIAIVARLWNVEDLTENGGDGQRFTVMGVDDSNGLESKLPRDCPEKVIIPSDIISGEQLGEGHIVELILHKRLAPAAPASRGGRTAGRQPSEILEFRFERRRWDIAVPMYHSTISAIIHQVKHSWTREYFTKTCELISSIPHSGTDSGASTPMTPSSPSMN